MIPSGNRINPLDSPTCVALFLVTAGILALNISATALGYTTGAIKLMYGGPCPPGSGIAPENCYDFFFKGFEDRLAGRVSVFLIYFNAVIQAVASAAILLFSILIGLAYRIIGLKKWRFLLQFILGFTVISFLEKWVTLAVGLSALSLHRQEFFGTVTDLIPFVPVGFYVVPFEPVTVSALAGFIIGWVFGVASGVRRPLG